MTIEAAPQEVKVILRFTDFGGFEPPARLG
jgi:hypothetical protein